MADTWKGCGTTGQGHGKPVDWWAFGVLVYEMLAGFPPFFDDDAMATYQKVRATTMTQAIGPSALDRVQS
eukprot:4534851-Pyramimonas_sp.AAC.1